MIFFSITTEIFLSITKEICSLFPGESEETYFIPFSISIKDGKKVRSAARGKLWSKYVNVRAALRLLQGSTNKSSRRSIQDVECEQTREISEKLDILKKIKEPIHKIQALWEETLDSRRKKFKKCHISELFNTFPCLKDKNGAVLVKRKIFNNNNLCILFYFVLSWRLILIFFILTKQTTYIHFSQKR